MSVRTVARQGPGLLRVYLAAEERVLAGAFSVGVMGASALVDDAVARGLGRDAWAACQARLDALAARGVLVWCSQEPAGVAGGVSS